MADSSAPEKVEFIWDEPRPRIVVPDRLVFRAVQDDGDEQTFRQAIGLVLSGSLDRGDQDTLTREGFDATVDGYLRPPPDLFAYEKAWWHLAYTAAGELVGFTQPVVYRGSRQGHLEEATLHYIGVVPDHRGNGYIDDLLRHATATLQRIGVWRIFCDTDTRNTPMIAAFERTGYRRGDVKGLPG